MARWKQDWTAEEIEKLRTLAGTMPLTQIAPNWGGPVAGAGRIR
ncbi:hypothetical protein ABIF68_004021 [Bradyrhizobium japonicum]